MHEHRIENSRTISRSHPLYGKKTYVPRMVEGRRGHWRQCCGRWASMRKSRRTRMRGRWIWEANFSSGDECYPLKVTLGDFLRIAEQPGFDPEKTAFFMATGHGPCRFGQYSPLSEGRS